MVASAGALAVRRTLLARRYGHGVISPADVAVITADLHAQTAPRDLLDKAARMVATASGSSAARIVLGDEEPDLPVRWVVHALWSVATGSERTRRPGLRQGGSRGARLYLAPKTIRNRISDMLGKVEVGSREEAVALARASGLG